MFNAKQFVSDVKAVPGTWIFENYLGIAPLHGETVRIQSPHSSTGRDSISLYYSKSSQDYRWKCFSSGRGGSAVDYMMEHWNKNFSETAEIIRQDYTEYLKTGYSAERKIIIDAVKWKLKDYSLRSWITTDVPYWSPYNIGSDILDEFKVIPLSSFTMYKPETEYSAYQEFTVNNPYIYGYFTKSGDLYKIYQPKKTTGPKFTKILNHLQGEDQIKGFDKLVITSSLKDIMSMVSLNLAVDYIAPDSENTYLSVEELTRLVQTYNFKKIICLLDNDETGIRCMKHYQETLGIPYCYLSLAKDPSDAIKLHGAYPVWERLVPAMNRSFDFFEEFDLPIQQIVKQHGNRK